MCGIAGFWQVKPFSSIEATSRVAHAMGHAIRHRGPDAGGVFVDEDAQLTLVHRRLSIIDLSEAGSQPMTSPCGRYVIAFNGEIYNFLDIKKSLEDAVSLSWQGHSDTEILVTAITHWGLEKTLAQLNGMFAFALWDKKLKALSLVRDRFGEKPLYYGWAKQSLVFGSELSSLKQHPDWGNEIQPTALYQMIQFNNVPAPNSIYQDTFKLLPGHVLTMTQKNLSCRRLPESKPYWSLEAVLAERSMTDLPETELQQLTEQKLKDAVKIRMRSDVPLGAFLSGGIDSSLVVALMQSMSEQPIQTFSVGFNEAEYNEAKDAQAVANHLGTRHSTLMLTEQDALAVVPKLASIYDEPFADSSQIPTFLVAEFAKQQVTVALSGDAGDEVFGGYNRYLWGPAVWHKLERYPRGLLKFGLNSLNKLSPERLEWLTNRCLPNKFAIRNPKEKLQKAQALVNCDSPSALYRILVQQGFEPGALFNQNFSEQVSFEFSNHLTHLAEQLMLQDTLFYLPNDILTKVDRATMAVSLEGRIPFLDHTLVEWAWQLPLTMKIRQGTSKACLRELLYQYVPKALIERPKMGFGVPIEHWLRGQLKDWAADLLSETSLKRSGFFDHQVLKRLWQEHQSGSVNRHHVLWNVLMFQAWQAEQSTSLASDEAEFLTVTQR